MIVAGSDLEAAVAAVVDDLADAEIVVDQDVPPGAAPFEARTVAVLNRGVPGFAVESDGTLHTSLMRSCTGWPSGTWIDPPRRTAPDGSNFQLQHWTHTFDYALVSGDGDWREAGVPARSAEFSQPLLRRRRKDRGCRRVAAWGSLLEIEPAGTVQLGALKAAGNPLAAGSSQAVDPPTASRSGWSKHRGSHNRCRRPFGVAAGLGGVACRPARTAARTAPGFRRADAARL